MDTPSEPTPKAIVQRIHEKADWEASSMLKDVRFNFTCDLPFEQILEMRKTRRVFDPVSLRETRAFIKHLFSPHHVGQKARFGQLRKAFISAGALHPIDVVILSGPEVDEEPILFDDRRRRFVTLPVLDPIGLQSAIHRANEIQPLADGHLLLFAGDGRRVANSYESAESLLWRDAGAALQTCALAAQAYKYAFCPLGLLGGAALEALGPPHTDYVALGLSVFGR